MELLDIFFYAQSINTTLSVIFNSFLVYLVAKYTKNNIGAYKWIIVSFAIFEAIYSLVVLMGMPVHYVSEGSWLVFNHGGLIGGTSFAFLGPSLYCIFYEIWIGLIVLHFLYRYIVVCKPNFKSNVEEHLYMKIFVVFLHFAFLAFTLVCGLYLCTRQIITETLNDKVRHQFNIDKNSSIGYILLRHKSNGEVSIFGTTTIINHYVLVGMSSIIIAYCSIGIWKAINQLQKTSCPGREVNLQRQMFYSLIIQTLVPVIFCHIPSAVYLSFPFWDGNFSFGISSLIFTWVTSANKFVDPIIVIVCIREYRKTTMAILRGNRVSQIRSGSTTGIEPVPRVLSNGCAPDSGKKEESSEAAQKF